MHTYDNPDIIREVRIEERKSAPLGSDLRWRAFCPGDYDGFGPTAEDALRDLIRRNA